MYITLKELFLDLFDALLINFRSVNINKLLLYNLNVFITIFEANNY